MDIMAHDHEQGSEEWLKARVGFITGSMVGAVLNCSPFMSRKAALKRMVQESLGNIGGHYTSEAMRWGTAHEDKAVKLYEALYGDKPIEKCGFYTRGDLGASPDRMIGEEGLLEIKCPWSMRNDERPQFKSYGDPEMKHYWHQVQCQMYVTNRSWCDTLQWTPHDHKLERIARDPEWVNDNADEFVAFLAEFEALKHTAITGGAAERLVLTPAWEEAAENYAKLKEAADRAKALLDEARGDLIALARESEVEEVDGSGVKVQKVVSQGSVDWKLAMKELGSEEDLLKAEKEYRRSGTVKWQINLTKYCGKSTN